jgi:hypothetical protein
VCCFFSLASSRWGASLGIAWALSRSSRAGRVQSAWLLICVSVLLFLLGVTLCWFGVSTLVER